MEANNMSYSDLIGLCGGLFLALLMAYGVYRMAKTDYSGVHK
jgi:hypothetical protein